jgi:hypothetical protein
VNSRGFRRFGVQRAVAAAALAVLVFGSGIVAGKTSGATISGGISVGSADRVPSPAAAARQGPIEDSTVATPIPYSVPLITWPVPAPITYGTALDGRELDASVTFSGIIVPGFISYTPSSGTILHAGPTQELLAAFVPSVQHFFGATGSVLITVNPAPTTLSLTASALPLGAGGPITLTAAISTTVTGVDPPVGNVTFYDGSLMLNSPQALVSGSARITVPHLAAGAHNFHAGFAAIPNSLGNPDFAPSTAAAVVGANQAATQLMLSATNSLSYVGQSVSYAARVFSASGGTPTGTVTFFDVTGSAPRVLGSGQLDTDGYAHAAQASPSVGAFRILAVYGGDGEFHGAQSAILTEVIRSCTVSAHLVLRSVAALDAQAGAQVAAGAYLSLAVGKSQIRVGNALVTYCSNPGRSTAQAVVAGIITGASGTLKKGDPVAVTLRMIGASRSPDAVLVDLKAKQRLAVSGPYDTGSSLRISTP